MTGNLGTPFSSQVLRWTAFLVVAASLGFIADYSELSRSATITEVAAEYSDALVPAALAKALCATILVAHLAFFFAVLWPRRHRVRVYDKLVIPLALTSLLAASWVVAFRHKEMGLSLAIVAASAVLGGVMFARAASVSPRRRFLWLRVPFSLHFGAMTIALFIALTQWLNATNLLAGTVVAPENLATAFLAIVAALGGFVALRYSDVVYPAVIASGTGAMFLAQHAHHRDVAVAALIVCVGMLVVAALAALALARQPRRGAAGKASGRPAKVARRAKDERWYLIEASTSIMRL